MRTIEPVKTPKVIITKSMVVSTTRVLTILMIFVLYILADYIKARLTGGVITDTVYWIQTFINMVLIIAIMLTVRSMRKDKKLNDSAEIVDSMNQIDMGFKVITVNGYSSKLDDYICELNKQNKYETFLSQIRRKLLKIGDKEKYDAKRKELNRLLSLPKEEVLKMNIKYKRLTVSKLFSSVDGKIINDNEYDVDTYEKEDIAKMVGLKALLIILFSAFTGAIITDFMFGGLAVLYSTFLKIFSLLLAVNTAMNIADDFVEHNIKTSVGRRLRHLAGFVNQTPELKQLIDNYKKEKIYAKQQRIEDYTKTHD